MQNAKANNDYQQEQKNLKEAENKRIENLKPIKGKMLSFNDFLEYKSLTQSTVTISVIGSSVTAGTGASIPSLSWAGRLGNTRVTNNNLKLINDGHGGYSTRDLIARNTIQPLIDSHPDLVIFETSLLNDHGQGIPINETINNINSIVNKIQTALPNTPIILISPNPSAKKQATDLNELKLSYQDYINASSKFIGQNNWNYIDAYSEMNQKIISTKTDLNTILSDGIHPNDNGYKIWFDVISNYFGQKREWK
jgi:lysophospholipase L1-like esterase